MQILQAAQITGWPQAMRTARPTVLALLDEARAGWAGREFVITDEPVWSGKAIILGSRER